MITSLHSEKNVLEYAVPGGLIGVGTKLDPDLCRGDKLIGQVMGHVGKLPPVFSQIEISFNLMKRIIGCKDDESSIKKEIDKNDTNKNTTNKNTTNKKNEINEKNEKNKRKKVTTLEKDEQLMINIGSFSVTSMVLGVKENLARLILSAPVCTMEGEKIAISRNIQSHWRLIGWGEITRGKQVEIKY